MQRFDERDILFARMQYKEGSPEYEDYYQRHPERKEVDDTLRAMPGLGVEGTGNYNPLNSPIIDATFRFLADMKQFAEGPVNPKKAEAEPTVFTDKVKGLAHYYGAKLVGIVEMEDALYYSHRGRLPEIYGHEVTPDHKYGIVFAVEMAEDMIHRAPGLGQSIETTKGYVNAGIVGMIVSYYIRELGYEARNHMDGNYLVVAPLVAERAGLGEIGRIGVLVTKEFGPRVRLGVVTTNLPLIPDQQKDLGIRAVCKICGLCAQTCPGRAIASGEPELIDDLARWKNEPEKCFDIWHKLGNDCGVCLSTCPFCYNLEEELLERLTNDPTAVQELLQKHKEKYKFRYFNRNPHEWL